MSEFHIANENLATGIDMLDELSHRLVRIKNELQGFSKFSELAIVTEEFQNYSDLGALQRLANYYDEGGLKPLGEADTQLTWVADTANAANSAMDTVLKGLESTGNSNTWIISPIASDLRDSLNPASTSIKALSISAAVHQQRMHNDQATMDQIIRATKNAQKVESFFSQIGLAEVIVFVDRHLIFTLGIILTLFAFEMRQHRTWIPTTWQLLSSHAKIMRATFTAVFRPPVTPHQPNQPPPRADQTQNIYDKLEPEDTENKSDLYKDIAFLYDVFYCHDEESHAQQRFLLHFAARKHPVSDVGAGTGATAIYLAQHGIPVICVEPSTAMRSVLLTQLANIPNLDPLTTVINSDGQSFQLDTELPLILITNVFQHILLDNARNQLLLNIWTHLQAKGYLIVDFRINQACTEQSRTLHSERHIGAMHYMHFAQIRRQSERLWEHIWWFETHCNHQLVESTDPRRFVMRADSRAECLALLHQHGFQVYREFSDYKFSPFHDEQSQQRLILVARKVS